VVAVGDASPERAGVLAEHGLRVIRIGPAPIGIEALLQELGRLGLTRLLVEGGSAVAAAFARANLIDRIAWYHAPVFLGGDGVPALAALGISELREAPRFHRTAALTLGEDVLETFARAD
jgi:diaminohydroxyphosphoribosylaminopyrimidine deaminase/5-amino-6-(5-phosphoribosylamino)uracil reductase